MIKKLGDPCLQCGDVEKYTKGGCVSCTKERAKQWKKNNPDKVRAGDLKYRRNNPEKMIEIRRRGYLKNKEKELKRAKRWRDQNPEWFKEYSKKYYEENSERIIEYTQKYRSENPEKVRETLARYRQENPEKVKKRRKDWLDRHPEKNSEYHARRRANIADAGWEPYSLQEIIERDGIDCGLCGSPIDLSIKWDPEWKNRESNLQYRTIDHLTPISRKGPDVLGNVQLAHFSCNSKKNNRVDIVAYPQLAISLTPPEIEASSEVEGFEIEDAEEVVEAEIVE